MGLAKVRVISIGAAGNGTRGLVGFLLHERGEAGEAEGPDQDVGPIQSGVALCFPPQSRGIFAWPGGTSGESPA